MWDGTEIINIALIDSADFGTAEDSGIRIKLDTGEVKGLRKFNP